MAGSQLRLVSGLLLVFLASLGLNWPDLPFNARLADVCFVALAAAVAGAGGPGPGRHRLDAVVAAYVLGGVPSFFASSDPGASAVEVLRQAYLVAIYAVIAAVVVRGYAHVVVTGIAVGGTMLALAGLGCVLLNQIAGIDVPAAGQVMALPYVGEVMRLRAFTASEAMLACLLAMAVPGALALRDRTGHPRVRNAWGLAAASGVVASVLTFAAAASGVVVGVVLALWPRWSHRPALRRVMCQDRRTPQARASPASNHRREGSPFPRRAPASATTPKAGPHTASTTEALRRGRLTSQVADYQSGPEQATGFLFREKLPLGASWPSIIQAGRPEDRQGIPLYAMMAEALFDALQHAALLWRGDRPAYSRMLGNLFAKAATFSGERAAAGYHAVYAAATAARPEA